MVRVKRYLVYLLIRIYFGDFSESYFSKGMDKGGDKSRF